MTHCPTCGRELDRDILTCCGHRFHRRPGDTEHAQLFTDDVPPEAVERAAIALSGLLAGRWYATVRKEVA